MKIHDTNSSGIGGLTNAEMGHSSRTGNSNQSRNGATDQIQLSALSSSLKAGDVQSSAQNQRVEQLRAAVASGTYQVDSHTLSGSMLRAHTAWAGE